ncbi:MAG: methyltransferase, partial [Planctomycetes bacterium]|nr:methyltransferase [Planctomycetota bacterium]
MKRPAATAPVLPWIARTQTFSFRRTSVALALGRDLFSSAAVDVGTSRLLRTLERKGAPLAVELGRPLRVLDLGCGAGPIGVAIARALACGTVQVVLTDRDRLAVALAQDNCRANGLDPRGAAARVLCAGLGYEPCRAAGEEPFDLIVSNVPAKAGEHGLEELLLGAGPLLRPGGIVAFVHVAPLAGAIDALRAAFAADQGALEVLHESAGREHRALFWRFP